jgi:hypothetical protein
MGRIKANARLARTLMRLSIDHFDPSEVRRLRARAWEALDDARMDKERL